MNADIHSLSNEFMYGGEMKLGSEEVSSQKLSFPKSIHTETSWLDDLKTRNAVLLKIDGIILR